MMAKKSIKKQAFITCVSDDKLSSEYWLPGKDKPVKVYVWDDDIGDAVDFYNDSASGRKIKESWLEFDGFDLLDPEDFVDPVFFDKMPKGWLLKFPEDEWESEMEEAHGRIFSKTIMMWKIGEMRAGISINDDFSDGRGRAIFFHAIGEKIPVAFFYAVRPNKKSITKD